MSSPRRLGLPETLRMRHDNHYVDQLGRPGGVPIGRLVPIEGQESHMIVRAAIADALVHVPRGDGMLAAGSPCRYLPLGAA